MDPGIDKQGVFTGAEFEAEVCAAEWESIPYLSLPVLKFLYIQWLGVHDAQLKSKSIRNDIMHAIDDSKKDPWLSIHTQVGNKFDWPSASVMARDMFLNASLPVQGASVSESCSKVASDDLISMMENLRVGQRTCEYACALLGVCWLLNLARETYYRQNYSKTPAAEELLNKYLMEHGAHPNTFKTNEVKNSKRLNQLRNVISFHVRCRNIEKSEVKKWQEECKTYEEVMGMVKERVPAEEYAQIEQRMDEKKEDFNIGQILHNFHTSTTKLRTHRSPGQMLEEVDAVFRQMPQLLCVPLVLCEVNGGNLCSAPFNDMPDYPSAYPARAMLNRVAQEIGYTLPSVDVSVEDKASVQKVLGDTQLANSKKGEGRGSWRGGARGGGKSWGREVRGGGKSWGGGAWGRGARGGAPGGKW